ncbi:putative purine nucleoside phosphorylase [Trichinella spiralis]|uniref:Purine nucleoside phosphorylase n=1 Tax=Trichinella spiralis TaxID=6334 RepID=A0ABR3KUP5_TRISP
MSNTTFFFSRLSSSAEDEHEQCRVAANYLKLKIKQNIQIAILCSENFAEIGTFLSNSETISCEETVAPVRILHLLGAELILLISNAHSLNQKFKAGDFMIIKDHLNFAELMGFSALAGRYENLYGVYTVLGSDAIGMNLCHEVVAARQYNMRVVAIAVIRPAVREKNEQEKIPDAANQQIVCCR